MPQPFTNSLKLDGRLELTRADLQAYMHEGVRAEFLKTKEQKQSSVEPFPPPYVFAKLASNAYEESEDPAALPPGWQFLTASQTDTGYFGRAFWRPESQQVVIAHRGTKSRHDFGADLKGVGLTKFVPHMGSAATFVHKVLAPLADLEEKLGFRFQVFFTGHSLGGWLCQITTFTAKYLKLIGENFLMNENFSNEGYHAHTVAFDSPGCKDMLIKMQDKCDVRYKHATSIGNLDITSFLSAPNLVNTVGLHVGKLFRIFIDDYKFANSYRDWKQYNLETHRMSNILEVFDPATGHAKTDPNGNLKVKEVIDWPVYEMRIPLFQSNESDMFFKWATKFNRFHLEPVSEEFRLELEHKQGYNPIRYETKNYEGNKCGLNVFTKDEQQFLKIHRVLRNSPGFLKPAELFASVREAADMLKTFDIEQGVFKCSTSEELLKVIPYIKRLLQLFPDVGARTEDFLSNKDFHKIFYLYESKCTCARIETSYWDFNDDSILSNILSNATSMIYQLVVKEDTSLRLGKLYKSLEKIRREGSFQAYRFEERFLVLELEHLSEIHKLFSFVELFDKTDINLVMIECKQIDKEQKATLKQVFKGVSRALASKNGLKIVLLAQEGADSDTVSAKIEAVQDELNYSLPYQLVELEPFSWHELARQSQESLLDREVMFQDNPIRLGQLVPADHCDLGQMIDSETLARLAKNALIKIGDRQPAFSFNQAYYIERSLNVAGKTSCRENEFLELARDLRTILISEKAGMGKSTILTRLWQLMKEDPIYADVWLIRVDFKDHTKLLRDIKERQAINNITLSKVIRLFQTEYLKLETRFERALFERCLDTNRMIMMFDGFDEISSEYLDEANKLFQVLKASRLRQLWVTTRPHQQEFLEESLQERAITLAPFSREDQVNFLTKFWSAGPCQNQKSRQFAEALLDLVSTSICDKHKEFAGIPLQTRLLAEVFQKEFQAFCASEKPVLPTKLNLTDLYERFTRRKFEIYLQEKNNVDLSKAGLKEIIDKEYSKFTSQLRNLALMSLFPEADLKILLKLKCLQEFSNEHPKMVDRLHDVSKQLADALYEEKLDELNSFIGRIQSGKENTDIVDRIVENKPHFIHRTFAEYFVSSFFAQQLGIEWKENFQADSKQMLKILKRILTGKECKLTRIFLNNQISLNNLPKSETNKWLGSLMQQAVQQEALRTAAIEGNDRIVSLLVASHASDKETLKGLLNRSCSKQTAMHSAAENGHVEIMEILAKNGADINANWGDNKYTPLHLASEKDRIEAVFYLVENGADIHAKGTDGRTALHIAAKRGLPRVVECLVAKGLLINAQDETGKCTPLLLAAKKGHFDVVRFLVEKQADVNSKDVWNKTALHYAAKEGFKEIAECLVNKNADVKAETAAKQTALHIAAENGHIDITLILISKMASLDCRDKNGCTALHYAAENDHDEIVKELVKKGATVNLQNGDGRTALNIFAEKSNLEMIEFLKQNGANLNVYGPHIYETGGYGR